MTYETTRSGKHSRIEHLYCAILPDAQHKKYSRNRTTLRDLLTNVGFIKLENNTYYLPYQKRSLDYHDWLIFAFVMAEEAYRNQTVNSDELTPSQEFALTYGISAAGKARKKMGIHAMRQVKTEKQSDFESKEPFELMKIKPEKDDWFGEFCVPIKPQT